MSVMALASEMAAGRRASCIVSWLWCICNLDNRTTTVKLYVVLKFIDFVDESFTVPSYERRCMIYKRKAAR